ncbi:MAG: flagellar hook-basal body complex protein FliE [Legionella sp.]|nr:flagellar hook-basal body complex protein FliE [Legionella sp.]HRD69694.1 flagellar hook-basal body complex protein FliE [Legionella sp.]
MSDINTANLINQIRTMTHQIEGGVSSPDVGHTSFNNVLQNALNQVNDLNQSADTLKTHFELGDPSVSLADVMIAGQKSNLGFEATLRVRNKLVQAYQDVMNMPV